MYKRPLQMIFMLLVLLTGCQVVPGTGDKISDAASAERFMPNITGFNSSDALNVSDALSKAGTTASIVTGNIKLAALIGKLDGIVQCYKNVGGVAARVYTEQTISTSRIPRIGVLAVINTTRIQRNLLSCALNTGNGAAQAQAVDDIQPCGGSGTKVVNNETLQYVYAATTPELCAAFQQPFK
jgi:hypothetical protein